MDSAIYIFGEFTSGYAQYPDDYSKNIYKELYKHAKATTQIAIHRNDNLMYYAYIRKLEESKQYIGLCIILNGIYITEFQKLFSLFEKHISTFITDGKFIHFKETGEITTSIGVLYKNKSDIEIFANKFREDFKKFEKNALTLPVTDFSIPAGSYKEFVFNNSSAEISKASYSYAFTYIYKVEGYETSDITSYKSILKGINEKNEKLQEENLELTKRNGEILRQKRQIKSIVILLIIIIIGGITAISIKNDMQNQIADLGNKTTALNKAKNNLETAVNEQKQEISYKKTQIDKLQAEIEKSKKEKYETEQKIFKLELDLNRTYKELDNKNNIIKELRQQLHSRATNTISSNQQTSTLNHEIISRLQKELTEKEEEIAELQKWQYAMSASSNSKDLYISNPIFSSTSRNNLGLKIKSVRITSSQTIIELEYENKYKTESINISPQTYIISYNTGKKYKLINAEGIPIAPQKQVLSHGKVRFKLIFEDLPKKTTKFNLVEGNSWIFYGIRLK